MSAYSRQRYKHTPFSGEARCVLTAPGLDSGLRAGPCLDRSRLKTRPVAPSPRPGRPLILLRTFIGRQVHRCARVLRGGKSSSPTSPTTKTIRPGSSGFRWLHENGAGNWPSCRVGIQNLPAGGLNTEYRTTPTPMYSRMCTLYFKGRKYLPGQTNFLPFRR